jgi:hypothetical protein
MPYTQSNVLIPLGTASTMSSFAAQVVSGIANAFISSGFGWSEHPIMSTNPYPTGYPYAYFYNNYVADPTSRSSWGAITHTSGATLLITWAVDFATGNAINPASAEVGGSRGDYAYREIGLCLSLTPPGRQGPSGLAPNETLVNGFKWTGLISQYPSTTWGCMPPSIRPRGYGQGQRVGFRLQENMRRYNFDTLKSSLGNPLGQSVTIRCSIGLDGSGVVVFSDNFTNSWKPIIAWVFGPIMDTSASVNEGYDPNWGNWATITIAPNANSWMTSTGGGQLVDGEPGSNQSRSRMQVGFGAAYFAIQCAQPVGAGVWFPSVTRTRGDVPFTGLPCVVPQVNMLATSATDALRTAALIQVWCRNWDSDIDYRVTNEYVGTILPSACCIGNSSACGSVWSAHTHSTGKLTHLGSGFLVATGI